MLIVIKYFMVMVRICGSSSAARVFGFAIECNSNLSDDCVAKKIRRSPLSNSHRVIPGQMLALRYFTFSSLKCVSCCGLKTGEIGHRL